MKATYYVGLETDRYGGKTGVIVTKEKPLSMRGWEKVSASNAQEALKKAARWMPEVIYYPMVIK